MKRLFLFLPLIILLGLLALFAVGLKLDPTELPTALLNKPVPEFSLESVYSTDDTLTEADLKGQVALLNVWATWCPTCKEEHDQLNKMVREEGVVIYGINYKDDRTKAQTWLTEYDNPYAKNIYDPEGTLGLNLGVYGAPETYILDENGVIRYRHVGAVDENVWQQLKAIMQDLRTSGGGQS